MLLGKIIAFKTEPVNKQDECREAGVTVPGSMRVISETDKHDYGDMLKRFKSQLKEYSMTKVNSLTNKTNY